MAAFAPGDPQIGQCAERRDSATPLAAANELFILGIVAGQS